MATDSPNLRVVLESRITSRMATDEDFFFFIADHINEIRASAKKVLPSEMFKYSFRNNLRRYLVESQCEEDIHWIAYLINRMKPTDSVLTKRIIYIPDIDTIDKLVDVYNNLLAQKDKEPTTL